MHRRTCWKAFRSGRLSRSLLTAELLDAVGAVYVVEGATATQHSPCNDDHRQRGWRRFGDLFAGAGGDYGPRLSRQRYMSSIHSIGNDRPLPTTWRFAFHGEGARFVNAGVLAGLLTHGIGSFARE